MSRPQGRRAVRRAVCVRLGAGGDQRSTIRSSCSNLGPCTPNVKRSCPATTGIIPLGQAPTWSGTGTDVTIVALGQMVGTALEASKARELDVEFSISARSCRGTRQRCGVGRADRAGSSSSRRLRTRAVGAAEIVAHVASECFGTLNAAPVGGSRAPTCLCRNQRTSNAGTCRMPTCVRAAQR